MNKKQSTIKDKRYGIFAIVFIGIMILSACNDSFRPPVQIKIPALEDGYGRIIISIAGESEATKARTVMPSSAFDKYEYTFTKSGETNGVEKEPDSEGFFLLELGAYTVSVKAYIGDDEPYILAAIGESSEFIVTPGDNNEPIEVLLSGLDSMELGEFSYTINFPEYVISYPVEISLKKWPQLSDIALDPDDIMNYTHGTLIGKTETLALEAGSYLFSVYISTDFDGFRSIGISEAIHIYPLTSTVYTKEFLNDDLIALVSPAPQMPIVDPPGGTYPLDNEFGKTIYLSTATEGATIYFTTDNSMPSTTNGNFIYPDYGTYQFQITGPTVIKAVAYKGGVYSSLLTASYIIPLPKPYTNPSPGNYSLPVSISIYASSGSVIHYTLNGDTPTTSSAVYSGQILITETCTIKAIAVRDSVISDVYEGVYTIPAGYTNFIKRVPFTEASTASVSFNNLSGNDIYLVKVNTSSSTRGSAYTGGVSGFSPSFFQGGFFNPPKDNLPIMGHPAAMEFKDREHPLISEGQQGSLFNFIPPQVNDTRMFYVETTYGSGSFTQKQATLRAVGTYGNIWVLDENFTSGTGTGTLISVSQAEAIRDKFDLIYPAAVNILGYENGGGPGGNGGVDEDPKIQILAYNIGSNVAGYFSSKDYLYTLGASGSNQAEIMYINTSLTNSRPNFIYSTLIHELQHMICYNQRWIRRRRAVEDWYTEMLSMMAEDLIAPLIGIDQGNTDYVTDVRMPVFLGTYDQVGITEWPPALSNESYGKGYAFGAYLLRNYGGAQLLKNILESSGTTGLYTVEYAARETTSQSINFSELVSRFGEAMILSGSSMSADVTSFDRTVTNTINSYTYTASGFDIWDDFSQKGPVIFTLAQKEMRGYSVSVHSDAQWKNITGTFTVTFNKPTDSSIQFYLMIR